MPEWPVVRLGDVAELLTGFPFASSRYTDKASDARLLRGDNIVQGALRWDGVKRWPADAMDGTGDYALQAGDVVVAMDRPWIEAGLKYATVRRDDLPALLVQRVARLRGKSSLHTPYLRYIIGSRNFTEYVLSVQTGTTVPHISGTQLKEFTFPLPPLREQQAIARILDGLDDKIELNRRMSETLEAMARALFKSWFVDFDPVLIGGGGLGLPRAADIANLSSTTIDSWAVGDLPGDWTLGVLGDVAEQRRELVDPRMSPEDSFHHFSLPAFDNGRRPETQLGSDIKSVKYAVPRGCVLVSKLNPGIPRVWLVDPERDARSVASTEFLVLVPKAPATRAYVWGVTQSTAFRRDLESLATGTSGSHQRARPDDVLGLPAVLPSPEVLAIFDRVVEPMLGRGLVARRESATLAQLRDALLPKLISGELRVPDAEGIAEEVGA